MMLFADFNYYQNEFGGSLVPESGWNKAAGKAGDLINAATFGRIETEIPAQFETNIKRCCCEMAEFIYAYAENLVKSGTGQATAKSYEQIGSYAVNYASVSDSISSLLDGTPSGLKTLLDEIIRKHLGRTGLLFRGVG